MNAVNCGCEDEAAKKGSFKFDSLYYLLSRYMQRSR